MKNLLGMILVAFGLIAIGQYCESKKDPYEVGAHWDYSIVCENGFIYKVLSNRRGVIQIFNSDGTQLRCGETRY